MEGIEGVINNDFINEMVDQTAIDGGGGDDAGFDRDMFLRILMTQLENQSPFDTVETEKILEQQAILTEVEQNVKQTTTLENLQETVDIGLADISTTLANINTTLATLVTGQNGGGEE